MVFWSLACASHGLASTLIMLVGSRLLLGVWSTNEAALAFYERIGFTRAGTRTFRIGAQDCAERVGDA